MEFRERRAWIMGVVAAVGYLTYVAIVAATEISYRPALLWTIGGGVVTTIVVDVATSVRYPADERRMDQRDREIDRFGDHIGNSLVVIGACAAIVLALLEWSYFWIANVIYLAFVLSAVLGSMARIAAYRKGFHPW